MEKNISIYDVKTKKKLLRNNELKCTVYEAKIICGQVSLVCLGRGVVRRLYDKC